MLEQLPGLLSVGALVTFAIVMGAIVVDVSTWGSPYFEIPRSIQRRAVVRSLTISEFIVLVATMTWVASTLAEGGGHKLHKTLLGMTLASFALRMVSQFSHLGLKDFLRRHRQAHGIGVVIVVAWASASFAVMKLVSKPEDVALATLVVLYSLAVAIIGRAALSDDGSQHAARISLVMIDGTRHDDVPLVNETGDFFVLGSAPDRNLLISKSNVKQAEVWLGQTKQESSHKAEKKTAADSRASSEVG